MFFKQLCQGQRRSIVQTIVEDIHGKRNQKSFPCINFTISCQSSQPVGWKYEGPKVSNLDKIVKPLTSTRSAVNGTMYSYESSISITFQDWQKVYSGWFACEVLPRNEESIPNSRTKAYYDEDNSIKDGCRASVYLYQQNGSENYGQGITIISNPIATVRPLRTNQTIIPCPSNSSTGVPRLEKLDNKNSSFMSITDDNPLHYDPGLGFVIEQMTERIDGMYRCAHQDESEALFLINAGTQVVLSPDPAALTPVMTDVMTEADADFLYLTNTLNISCNASQYLYSDGLQLAVGFKNGSTSRANGMVLQSTRRYEKGFYNYTWKVNVTSPEITSYICMIPFPNSNQWMKISSNVTIIYGVAPKMLINHPRMSSPNVTFRTDAKDVSITCVAEGVPPPVFHWYVLGHNFRPAYNTIPAFNDLSETYPNVTINYLRLPAIKNTGTVVDVAWVCVASNGIGLNANYTINVGLVDPRNSVNLEDRRPGLAIVYILAVALVGSITIGMVMYRRHKARVKRRLKQLLLSDEFIDKFWNGDSELLNDLRRSRVEINGRKIAESIPFSKELLLKPEDLKEDPANELGKGFFGKVIAGTYKQKDGEEVPVAIKLPQPTENSNEAAIRIRSLLEEAKVLSYTGNHEHVVRLVGAVIVCGANGIYEKARVVLERCETSLYGYLQNNQNRFCNENSEQGQNYQNQCEQRRPGYSSWSTVPAEVLPIITAETAAIKTSDLIRWSFQISCGMQYLTSRKIIHRDLAARNVLLSNNNGRLDAKITDFGLSKELQNGQYEYLGRAVALPWPYLAPELFEETKRFSQATDVWAYGITIWEIFTLAREAPYSRFENASDDFIKAIRNDNLRNPKPDYASEVIYELMLKCWDKDPKMRPTFKDLTQKFLGLLPKEEVERIPPQVYEPRDEIDFGDLEHLLARRRSSLMEETREKIRGLYTNLRSFMRLG